MILTLHYQLCSTYHHEESVCSLKDFSYDCAHDPLHIHRYGHTVVDGNDPYVHLVDKASQSTSEAAVPGAFLVDLFPSRKSL